MGKKNKRIEEAKEVITQETQTFRKTSKIIFDGKQYNVRIPKDFAEKAGVDPKKDEFEFILILMADREIPPILVGDLVDKEE